MTYSMTDEQRFIFDLKGWLLIPSVLQPDEIREIKEFLDALQFNPESLPERDRHVCGGACSQLLDHPVVVGVLNEIIASRRKCTRRRRAYSESAEEPKTLRFPLRCLASRAPNLRSKSQRIGSAAIAAA